jgi:hypothetical protein
VDFNKDFEFLLENFYLKTPKMSTKDHPHLKTKNLHKPQDTDGIEQAGLQSRKYFDIGSFLPQFCQFIWLCHNFPTFPSLQHCFSRFLVTFLQNTRTKWSWWH